MKKEIFKILMDWYPDKPVQNTAISIDIFALIGENETGVSDADSKDGVLHSVMECNAHGKTDELNAATDECGYEKITETKEVCERCNGTGINPDYGFGNYNACPDCQW